MKQVTTIISINESILMLSLEVNRWISQQTSETFNIISISVVPQVVNLNDVLTAFITYDV